MFNAKKEVLDAEISTAQELLKNLKDQSVTVQDCEIQLSELKNIQKTKEFNAVLSAIKNIKNEKIQEAKISRLGEYSKIFAALNDDNDQSVSLSKNIVTAIVKSKTNKKTRI